MNRIQFSLLALLSSLALASLGCGGSSSRPDGADGDGDGDADAAVDAADGGGDEAQDAGPDGSDGQADVGPDGGGDEMEDGGADAGGDGVEDGDSDAGPDGGGDESPDGGADGGDGGDGGTGEIEECADLTPLPSGTCQAAAGDGNLLIRGDILLPDRVLRGGQILISSEGWIQCVSCDCSGEPLAAGATRLTCPRGAVSPGLINAHEHLTFAQNPPGNWGTERYDHRHEWRRGLNGHTRIVVPGGATALQVAWGEIRHLLGGETTIAGAGSAAGFLRNMDGGSQQGLNQGTVNSQTFPLGDSSGVMLNGSCAYPDIDSQSVLQSDCYLPHIAEGVNAEARNEFLCLSGAQAGGVDLIAGNVGAIHLVGMLPVDGQAVADDGAGLVWSPRSNVSLYGNTAPVTLFAAQGMRIAIGTDWSASGSINMARELRCADYLNRYHYHSFFSDRELWLMATAQPASILAIDDAVGVLAPGRVADIAIFAEHDQREFYRAVIEAGPGDLALVLRAGLPLVGDRDIMAVLPGGQTGCEPIPGDVCGVPKNICVQREIGQSFAALAAANATAYGLFFCGDPTGEPSCVPMRPSEYDGTPSDEDRDGDGIPNTADNCPDIFNPVRPMDQGLQGDQDDDGVGDACDVCPLDPDTTSCSPPDPNDRDRDGVANASDNCPLIPNPNQADRDLDFIGDVCDPCPDEPNPGFSPCPATIYAVKIGSVPTGSAVSIQGVVTGVASPRFFLQVPPAEQDPQLREQFSGIYVYLPSTNPGGFPIPVRGDRVRVTGTVTLWYGQIEISSVSATQILSHGEPLPQPVAVLPSDVATGGSLAAAYEGVLVKVENAEVTALNPPAGAGDTNPTQEYVLDNALRVNDFMYLTTPFPQLGDRLDATGILRFANNDSKLEPRDVYDVVFRSSTPPRLTGLGPSPVYVYEGQSMASPDLLVTLDRPSPVGMGGTVVAISVGDESRLSAPASITVPEGARQASVPLTGLMSGNDPISVTATLDADSFTAQALVLASGRIPAPVALSPANASIPLGGALDFTVTLDVPAPSGGCSIAIAAADPLIVSAPAQAMAPAGSFSAVFSASGVAEGGTLLSASTAAGSVDTPVAVVPGGTGGFVINEVDYDQAGTDNAEWCELYNGTGRSLDLNGFSLIFVNGGTNPASIYRTLNLSAVGSLGPGQYLVVGAASVQASLPPDTPFISLGTGSDYIQNGAPDGLVLVDDNAATVVDALSYEGSITAVAIPGVGTVSLVEGSPAPGADSNTAAGSMARIPDHTDTDNAASDWRFVNTPTPGAPNAAGR